MSAIIAFFLVVGFGCKATLSERCTNELYLLSAIAQSIAALGGLLIASTSIMFGSKLAIRQLATIMIQEKSLRYAFLLSFSVIAVSLVMLRTGYYWIVLWTVLCAAVLCLLLMAFAVYNLFALLKPSYFTSFFEHHVRIEAKKNEGPFVYIEGLSQWCEVMLEQNARDLAVRSLKLLYGITTNMDCAPKAREVAEDRYLELLRRAPSKVHENPSWYLVSPGKWYEP